MNAREDVVEFVERLTRIENEKKLLEEDKKILVNDFKSKLDVKAVQAAIRIAKIRARLGDTEAVLDEVLPAVCSKVSVGE
jgi:uncharacterized protein (UPF0335 family)|tara:strand:- start:842 stop:1081 length:240 start_codon:yes stop_codon:yes gene_type:complete